MPHVESGTTALSWRQRRRAVAIQEILSAAEAHIVEHGPHALSLRAVARSLGVTVQALYHYFASRDDLVTALITKAYDDLTSAVQAAVDGAADTAQPPRLVVAAEGYRGWAITHPERFQLVYGAPLRHYQAPLEGPTTQAVRRMSVVFRRELFGGFSAEQLEAIDAPALSPALQEHLERLAGNSGEAALPPAATALFLSAWGHLHGLVSLEVFGHTEFIGEHQAEVFRLSIRNLQDDIRRRVPAV